jgi:hypothetical protein
VALTAIKGGLMERKQKGVEGEEASALDALDGGD